MKRCKCKRFIETCKRCGKVIPYFCFQCIEDYKGECMCEPIKIEGKRLDDFNKEELEKLYAFLNVWGKNRMAAKVKKLFPGIIYSKNFSYLEIYRTLKAYSINKLVALSAAEEMKRKEALKYISIAVDCYIKLPEELRIINLQKEK